MTVPCVCSGCGARFWHGPGLALHDCPGVPQHTPETMSVLDPTRRRYCRACGQRWPCETARRNNP